MIWWQFWKWNGILILTYYYCIMKFPHTCWNWCIHCQPSTLPFALLRDNHPSSIFFLPSHMPKTRPLNTRFLVELLWFLRHLYFNRKFSDLFSRNWTFENLQQILFHLSCFNRILEQRNGQICFKGTRYQMKDLHIWAALLLLNLINQKLIQPKWSFWNITKGFEMRLIFLPKYYVVCFSIFSFHSFRWV